MVMMVHYLAVLPAGVGADDLDENWRGRVARFEERRFNSWIGAPRWMASRPHKQLDWGTVVYEISDDDLLALTGEGPGKMAPLSDSERYAALWVECY